MKEFRLQSYLGNGFDFGAEFGFDFVQGESVVVGDQVDCHTEMAEPSGPTDSVQVGLRHLGEVEVDDDIDCLDVDTTGEEVCKNIGRSQHGFVFLNSS